VHVRTKCADLKSKPVARHFNLPNHSSQHMRICGLSLHQGNTERCKNLEQQFIFEICTLNPHGTGLSTTFQVAGKKFLSSRIVIIERRRPSLLGESGGMPPPGHFYILSPQKRSFLDSEHKCPIMSVLKVT